jgi:hypothetical protein
MRALSSKRFALAGFLAAWLTACGGGTKPAESSVSGAEPGEAMHGESDKESSAEETTAAAAPVRATCDDGTCSPCGDALCPAGWYCDETAKGGPSCGWLPECAQKAGCACVKKALGCACEEKAGGAHVSCT